jgi:hypothetical protein
MRLVYQVSGENVRWGLHLVTSLFRRHSHHFPADHHRQETDAGDCHVAPDQPPAARVALSFQTRWHHTVSRSQALAVSIWGTHEHTHLELLWCTPLVGSMAGVR